MNIVNVSISRKLARQVLNTKYEDLPEEVIHQAKRVLLDALANVLGGRLSDASLISERAFSLLEGVHESTVIGSGMQLPCTHAAVTNGVALRYLDFMDTYAVPVSPTPSGTHPCENIPAILAIAEREHLSGKDVITAVVIAYELTARFCEAFAGLPLSVRGWHHSTFGQYIVPLVAGKLMALNEDQLVNAIGISGTHNMTLEIIDSPGEEYNMTKNIVYPFSSASGIQAALLAKEGFTGPERIIEGENGFIQSTVDRKCDLGKFEEKRDSYAIMNIIMKAYPVNILTAGVADCTLSLVTDNCIKPEEVSQIKVQVSAETESHTNDPVKRHPKNKESADHRTPYIVAMAIKDKEITPSQILPKWFADPLVNQLIDRVHMEANPEFINILQLASIVEIEMFSGIKYRQRVDFPKGTSINPIPDSELIEKFRSTVTSPVKQMDSHHIDQIVQRVFDLESAGNISSLMDLLHVQR
jgi:2-methylcitrate dehydratase